jgi:dTDP-glucose pyrophosphorylase
MISVDATLVDAMRSLEDSMSQIVLVVDQDDGLIGVLTDGDIRRALLAGHPLAGIASSYANRDCFTVSDRAGRADVLELMQARQVAQVPAVDAQGRVVGLHLLHELVSTLERPNWAVIMAGGRGKRLGELTAAVPKPMLPVAGKPILERIVLHLVGTGIRRIYLSVNYLAEVIEDYFGDGHRFGCSIEYLREQESLGTGGPLSLLPRGDRRPRDPILVMNGDLVTQANLGRIIDFHEAGDQAVTMGVRAYVEQVPFGCVEVRGDELIGFTEKPTSARLVNAGIYVFSPGALDTFTGPPETISMPEVVLRLQAEGHAVKVFEIDDDWIDVGRRDQLERARRGE